MHKRPQKRRRLSATAVTTTTSSPGADATCIIMQQWPRASAEPDTLVRALRDPADLSCTSCRRSLATSGVGGGATTRRGQLVVCPRCQATSCAICSRTCTSVPPSLPPTPLLSFSPSPSPSPPGTPLGPLDNRPLPHDAPGDTPRPRTHVHSHIQTASPRNGHPRRRRHRELDDDDEGTVVGADDNDYASSDAKDTRGVFLPGCGRTLCKNCCFENAQTGTTTCYECYGLPPPTAPPSQTQDCYSGGSLRCSLSSPSMAMTPLLI